MGLELWVLATSEQLVSSALLGSLPSAFASCSGSAPESSPTRCRRSMTATNFTANLKHDSPLRLLHEKALVNRATRQAKCTRGDILITEKESKIYTHSSGSTSPVRI